MMGHKEKIKYVDEIETIYKDMYHNHPFHRIKKRMTRRNRHKSKQELRIIHE